jgi:DNA-binding transcriptional regulator YiaG
VVERLLPREQALPIALRAMRETLNYSQETWSILLGVSRQTVVRWEFGIVLPGEHTLVMLRCRLNHEREADLWGPRLRQSPDVASLLVSCGLLDRHDG